MKQALSIAFLAGGILLAIFGANEMQSFSSDISRVFTGAPSDRAVWMTVGGVILIVLGAAGLLLGSRKG